MNKLLLMFGMAVAAFLSNADYLMWQVSEADAQAVGADKYNYATISYKVKDSEDGLKILQAATREDAAAGLISTDLSSLTSGTTYSLFIELINYNSANDSYSQVGVSNESITYTAGAINNVAFIDSQSQLPSANVPVWHGGAIDVPEPTSGMMVMLGFAFLALKRRKV